MSRNARKESEWDHWWPLWVIPSFPRPFFQLSAPTSAHPLAISASVARASASSCFVCACGQSRGSVKEAMKTMIGKHHLTQTKKWHNLRHHQNCGLIGPDQNDWWVLTWPQWSKYNYVRNIWITSIMAYHGQVHHTVASQTRGFQAPQIS